MGRERDVVDYVLQRRAVLTEVAMGRRSRAEVCDAHPYLMLAARHYGEPISSGCPLCAGPERLVHYVYGDAVGHSAGQAKSRAELSRLAGACASFDVYAVEVCTDCGWNHLARSFTLGDGDPAAAATR